MNFAQKYFTMSNSVILFMNEAMSSCSFLLCVLCVCANAVRVQKKPRECIERYIF